MPTASKKAKSSGLPFGPLFEAKTGSAEERGMRFTTDALRVIQNRLPGCATITSLPLTKAPRQKLMKASFAFLQRYCPGPFEKDNLSHVGRLVSNMKRHTKPLKEFLGVDTEDVQLLAVLHDLGKSRVCDPIYSYLSGIFGENDFINLRVVPHEMYSSYWIQEVARECGVADDIAHILMDQVANHNFGPDLDHPDNAPLLEKLPNGRFRHWWMDHWEAWSAKARAGGLQANAKYGHTVSPLANTLVLFDRVDGGHPHSWEKFLNQDFVSGSLTFTPQNILHILTESNLTAKAQILSVGRQIRTGFAPKKKSYLESFPPYEEALSMLNRNEQIIEKLRRSNEPANRAALGVTSKASLLYLDHKDHWYRVDEIRRPTPSAVLFAWDGNEWKEKKTSANPVELLLNEVYQDWR